MDTLQSNGAGHQRTRNALLMTQLTFCSWDAGRLIPALALQTLGLHQSALSQTFLPDPKPS